MEFRFSLQNLPFATGCYSDENMQIDAAEVSKTYGSF